MAVAATAADTDTACAICDSNMGVPAWQPGAADVDSDGSDDGATAMSGRRATYTFHATCAVGALRRDARCPKCRVPDGSSADSDVDVAGASAGAGAGAGAGYRLSLIHI